MSVGFWSAVAGAVSGMVGSGVSKFLTSKVNMLTPMAVNGLSGMVETVAENAVLGVKTNLSDLGLAFAASTALPGIGDNIARNVKQLTGQGDNVISGIKGLDGKVDEAMKTLPPTNPMQRQSKSGRYSGTGEYKDVGGHHVHAKAGFRGDQKYDPKKGFSISQEFMENYGLNHQNMTSKQRELFKELHESGRANTLDEHTRIAKEVLKAGGASDSMIDDLINASLENLKEQGVTAPTRIPWYSK